MLFPTTNKESFSDPPAVLTSITVSLSFDFLPPGHCLTLKNVFYGAFSDKISSLVRPENIRGRTFFE
jgi:hypothetical protein